MKKYGLFIGVNKYNRVSPWLKGAEADAELLAGIFAERLGFTTSVLTDEQLGYGGKGGSQDRIFEQLDDFREKLLADGGGVLLVYFAGHGITTDQGEQFLLAPKAPEHALIKPTAGDMGVFSEASLRKATEGWPGVKRAFIFDACRTSENSVPMAEGGVGGRLGMAVLRQEDDDLPDDLVILRSCPPDQIACELTNYGNGHDKKDHGLFSAALLEVVRQQADDKLPLVLDGELSQKLGHEMNRLAGQYIKDAAPALKARAQAQHPEFHGGRLCLIDKSDYRQIRIRGLLDKFEQQLAAGNLSDPPGESCRDILNQLAPLNYDSAARENLSVRLQAAEREKRKQAQHLQEEKLIETARRLGTPEAYAKYLQDCKLCEYEAEAESVVREAREHADEADWNEAQARDSLAGYRRYLSKHPYPHGLHGQEARQLFERMEREAVREKEESEWEQVRDGSLEDLRAFRASWPTGRRGDEADAAIARLEGEETLWSECCEVDTEESFQHYLDESELQSYASEAREHLGEKVTQRQANEADQVLWDAVSGDLAKLKAASDQWRTDEHRQKAQEKISDLEQVARDAREEALWSDCVHDDTEASYKRYLDKSELRRYEAEAKERLAGKVKQREAQKADQALWKKVSGSIVKLEAASGQWRTDEYRQKAQEKISELRQAEERGLQERAAREENLWTECCEEDTEESYQRYLDESELRRYEAEAGERLGEKKKESEEKLWSECSKADTEASYQYYLDKSELRRYETDARKRLTEKVKHREAVEADQALWKKVFSSRVKLEEAECQWCTEEYRLKAKEKISGLEQAARNKKEETLWSECREQDTEASYQRYLKNSELQRYEGEAKKRLVAIEEESKKLKADHTLWLSVYGDIAKLRAASGKWKTKEYREKARDRIADFEQQAAREAQEESLWLECSNEHTKASYQRYLAETVLRRHVTEANARLPFMQENKMSVVQEWCKGLVTLALGVLALWVLWGAGESLYKVWTQPSSSSSSESGAPHAPQVSQQNASSSADSIRRILEVNTAPPAEFFALLQHHAANKELASDIVQRYAKILGGDVMLKDAAARHRQAWRALDILAAFPEAGQFASMARKELDKYRARTDQLHSELRGLINDPTRQAKEKRWPEYQFRLNVHADRGDMGAALTLGVILASQGKTVPAFYMLLQAASGKDQAVRQQAGINLRNYLGKLMESENKQQARVLLPELKKLVDNGAGPDWQLWLARYYETLGELNSARALYQPLVRGADRNIGAMAATGLERLGN